MHIFIDFESRSTVDIKTRGAWVYSEDETTDVLCLAIKVDNAEPIIWMNEGITQLRGDLWAPDVWNLIDKADEIHAWNAGFERAIWQNVCHRRYGWPELPIHKLRCTMAKAAYHSLPMSLDAAASALGLPGKDIEGYKLMLRLSKPRKRDPLVWWGDADMFRRLGEYCKEDVNAEARIDDELYPLPDQERRIWQLDQEINARGILADVGACVDACGMLDEDKAASLKRFQEITHGSVKSPTQRDAFLKWLTLHGCDVAALRKADVTDALFTQELRPEVREALIIGQQLKMASVSKFSAIRARASSDGRLRGMFMYHAAGTGRWSSKGVQLQNLPRKKYHPADFDALSRHDHKWFNTFEKSVRDGLSNMVRGMFVAKPGHELCVADFSSIEARITAWLADDTPALDVFFRGMCAYRVAAVGIFNRPYESFGKNSMERQVGKCSELSLGFGGGIEAYANMAGVYNVDLEALPKFVFPQAAQEEKARAEQAAQRFVSEQETKEIPMFQRLSKNAAAACDIIKQKWRKNRPLTVGFWKKVDQAVIAAVETGRTQTVGRLKYGIKGRYLLCKLPSGRCIHYPFPQIENRKTKFVDQDGYPVYKKTATYMREDKGHWRRTHIWYGSAVENAVQGVARDFVADAMLRADARNLPVVLHVHDEVGAEVPKGAVTVEEFERLMATPPAWADGCPIGAEGYLSKRYRK